MSTGEARRRSFDARTADGIPATPGNIAFCAVAIASDGLIFISPKLATTTTLSGSD